MGRPVRGKQTVKGKSRVVFHELVDEVIESLVSVWRFAHRVTQESENS